MISDIILGVLASLGLVTIGWLICDATQHRREERKRRRSRRSADGYAAQRASIPELRDADRAA